MARETWMAELLNPDNRLYKLTEARGKFANF